MDESPFAKAQAKLQERGRPQARQYTDIRKLLEDKDVEAVSIATPNHWHALAGIWAMQAGRTCTSRSRSATTSPKAAGSSRPRKYNRICQAGTQSRSSPACQAGDRVHPRRAASARCCSPAGCATSAQQHRAFRRQRTVPPGVDYDLWLGPAPVRPFNKNRFHYDWHWNWDYGNGDIGNQGVHQMDIARWALGKGLPERGRRARRPVRLRGRRPDAQHATGPLRLRRCQPALRGPRPRNRRRLMGVGIGNIVYGTEGFVAFDCRLRQGGRVRQRRKEGQDIQGRRSPFRQLHQGGSQPQSNPT